LFKIFRNCIIRFVLLKKQKEKAIVKIQSFWRAKRAQNDYKSLSNQSKLNFIRLYFIIFVLIYK